jgi:hypothetical protein
MSTVDRNQGPRIGQIVWYNDAGTLRPGIIYSVASDGRVNISQFLAGTAVVDRQNVGYDVNQGTSKWCYPDVS